MVHVSSAIAHSMKMWESHIQTCSTEKYIQAPKVAQWHPASCLKQTVPAYEQAFYLLSCLQLCLQRCYSALTVTGIELNALTLRLEVGDFNLHRCNQGALAEPSTVVPAAHAVCPKCSRSACQWRPGLLNNAGMPTSHKVSKLHATTTATANQCRCIKQVHWCCVIWPCTFKLGSPVES